MSTLTQPHTNGHDRELGDVRTYRGRKLEDLIPQIRAELGPDAIILRQREGLMGGVGGFFAQKCVEVDAQAGGGRESHHRVDIYDEDEPVNGWDEGLEDFVAPAAPEPAPEVLDQTPALPAPEPPKPVAAEPIQPLSPVVEPIREPFAEPIQPPAPAEPAARWAQEADAFAAPPAQDIPAAPAPGRRGSDRRVVRQPPGAGRGARRHRRAGQAGDHGPRARERRARARPRACRADARPGPGARGSRSRDAALARWRPGCARGPRTNHPSPRGGRASQS